MPITGVSLSGLDPTFDLIVSLMAPKQIRYTARQYADFAEMKADYDATGYIYVNVDNSDLSIFGERSTNWQFRAWHDICHILTGGAFDAEGERKAAELQIHQLFELLDAGRIRPEEFVRWSMLIHAEVIGEVEYYMAHGEFPPNEREFIVQYLADRFAVDVATFPKTLEGCSVAW